MRPWLQGDEAAAGEERPLWASDTQASSELHPGRQARAAGSQSWRDAGSSHVSSPSVTLVISL